MIYIGAGECWFIYNIPVKSGSEEFEPTVGMLAPEGSSSGPGRPVPLFVGEAITTLSSKASNENMVISRRL